MTKGDRVLSSIKPHQIDTDRERLARIEKDRIILPLNHPKLTIDRAWTIVGCGMWDSN